MLIATPPRLSSDQEKNKSTEEAYPVDVEHISPKRHSGIFGSKRGDTQTYEEHPGEMTTPQSTYEYMTDWITTKQSKELSDNQQTITAKSAVYCNSVQPTVMKSDTQHDTKQPTESQGEELIYYIQHAETPPQQLVTSLKAAVQSDEFCNILQTETVASEESNLKTITAQSEELRSSVQMAAVLSELGNPLQSSAAQSRHLTNHLQIPKVKSDKFCDSIKTATLQSEEPFKSLQSATLQSEEPFKSLQCTTVQAEELHNSTLMPAMLSEKLLGCLQTETVHSEEPFNSLQTVADQSEELNRPLQTSTVQSEKLCVFPDTASLQSVELYNSQKAETVQQGGQYNLLQSEFARLDDLYHTGQVVPNQSEESIQATTVQADCRHMMEATQDHEDCTLNSGPKSTQFSEPYHVKQISTVQSEEIYLSRTCDSHWSDNVTANKVAVEGDLNG